MALTNWVGPFVPSLVDWSPHWPIGCARFFSSIIINVHYYRVYSRQQTTVHQDGAANHMLSSPLTAVITILYWSLWCGVLIPHFPHLVWPHLSQQWLQYWWLQCGVCIPCFPHLLTHSADNYIDCGAILDNFMFLWLISNSFTSLIPNSNSNQTP